MVNLAHEQHKIFNKRNSQRAAQKRHYEAVQSLQLISDELRARMQSSGGTDFPSSLRAEHAALSAQLPALQSASASTSEEVRTLLEKLYAEQNAEQLIEQLPGKIPFLLLPVRLETRFCRVRHVVRPANRQFLLDCSDWFPSQLHKNTLRNWGTHHSGEHLALQIRAPFPDIPNLTEQAFYDQLVFAIEEASLSPPSGRWLQRQSDAFELRIRVVPDNIHIDSFEEGLTPDEFQRGRQFWERIWNSDNPEQERALAWAELRNFFSIARSAWCVRQTQPLNFGDGTFSGQPQFPDRPVRANSYTQPPVAAVLPDFFTAILSKAGQPDRVVKGNLITGEVLAGFDPNEPDATAFQPDENGDLKFPEGLRWIFDFDEAEKKGMAIRVQLNQQEFQNGFDKVVVLGVKLSAGQTEGQQLLQKLLHNQTYHEKGMYVVPQGTPTNNFGTAKSGYNWPEREAAVHLKAAYGAGQVWGEKQLTDHFRKPDGLRLTQALGLDEDSSRRFPGADSEDSREALAMNRLLFPGTLGYYLRQFFLPPLKETDLSDLQTFFEKFVTGRGLIPAVRVGQQPYGIVPATAFKFWSSQNPLGFTQRLLDGVLKKLDAFWEEAKGKVRFAGDGSVPSLQYSKQLIELAATDPTSLRYRQKALFGEGYLNFILRLNALPFLGPAFAHGVGPMPKFNQFPELIDPQLWAKSFDPAHFSAFRWMHVYPKVRKLDGPVIDELPSSEHQPLSSFAGSKWNYLDWLLESSIEDLWKERFQNLPNPTSPLVPPKALLYFFARFALRRCALECTLRMLEPNEQLRLFKTRDLELLAVTGDNNFDVRPAALNDLSILGHSLKPILATFGIQNDFSLKPDRFGFFEQEINSQLVKHIIDGGDAPEAKPYQQQKEALAVLHGLPTARLERLFCEHVDLCSYRLDAWFNAVVHERLEEQRTDNPLGIYLGAFGVLEKVVPQKPGDFVKEVEPVFADQYNRETFAFPAIHVKGLQTLVSDVDRLLDNSFIYLGANPSNDCRLDLTVGKVVMSPKVSISNQGYILAPSPEHAATAAILRAGWTSRKAEDGADSNALAVRIDSPRVRSALALLEGIGQGDTLPALLGYQLERTLHDSGFNSLIFHLRRIFPLKTDDAATAFAATIDGIAVIEAKKANWANTNLSEDDRNKLGPIVDNLNGQFDALSDLMLTESVFQTVKGSPTRAAAALRTLSASGQLHQPEVVRTPQTGSLVTFRTGVIFPETNFLASWRFTFTPRGLASPQLNNWLASQLPDPAKVIFKITSGEVTRKLTLADLDVQPIDLLVLLPQQNLLTSKNNHMAWLAETLFRKQNTLPVDAVVNVDFTSSPDPGSDELSLFEISPLVHKLRALLASARPLTANDFVREGGQGAAPIFATDEIELAFRRLLVDVARKPGGLGERILDIQSELQTELEGKKQEEVLQAAWSGLLAALADAARWQTENSVLEISRKFTESQVQLLLQAAVNTATALQRIQTDGDALVTQLDTAPDAERFAICESLSEKLFGNTVRVCPAVQLSNAPVIAQAQNTDLSRNLDPLSLENWQCHSALVHPVFRMYRQCTLLREAFAAPGADKALTVIQFNTPEAPPGFWVGAEMKSPDTGEEVSQKYGGTLSLALELPEDWQPQNNQIGLMFDEWTDMLTARKTTAGVAFHFNQPDTEPPQVMLLAVCPAEGENWRWEYLTETITETFDRAKKRLLNLEQLRENPAVNHFLPAVVAPLDRENFCPNLDLGRNEFDKEIDEKGAASLAGL